MDVLSDSSGRTQGLLIPMSTFDMTLDRGMARETEEGVMAKLGGTVVQDVDGIPQNLGHYRIYARSATDDPDISDDRIVWGLVDNIADDSQGQRIGGDRVVWDNLGTGTRSDSSSDPVKIHFVPASRTEQLSGEPSDLFNTPDPGKPLIARFPALFQGEILATDLEIKRSGSDDSVLRIPVEFQHNPSSVHGETDCNSSSEEGDGGCFVTGLDDFANACSGPGMNGGASSNPDGSTTCSW